MPRTASGSASSNANGCPEGDTQEANEWPTRRWAPHRLTATGDLSRGVFTAAKRRDRRVSPVPHLANSGTNVPALRGSLSRGMGRRYRRRIANRMVPPRTDRSRTPAPLLVAVGCILVLALTACGQSSHMRAALLPPASSTYTLMQMNLCLSNLAGCYRKTAYPAVLEEAGARIREAHPDAVTFNEACRGDVGLIARRTGYRLRFSRVIYLGKPLACERPAGRGLFGNAVLTKAAIESTNSRSFEAQAGIER